LAFGLLDLQNDSNATPLGPYFANLERCRTIRGDWQAGKPDPAATRSALETLRQANPDDASIAVAKTLNEGVSADSLWDAVVLAAGELLVRSPGIIALHATTAANALHFIYGASGDETTRKLALLQAAGWIPYYRERIKAEPLALDGIEAIKPESRGEEAVGEIFAAIGKNRKQAAAKTIGYIESGGSPDVVFAAARRLIFRKGHDSHDYKYGAAAWEEFRLASDPRWQAPLTAAAMGNFPSSEAPDTPLMRNAQEAVARVMGRSGS
jgi:hypothetical protein